MPHGRNEKSNEKRNIKSKEGYRGRDDIYAWLNDFCGKAVQKLRFCTIFLLCKVFNQAY